MIFCEKSESLRWYVRFLIHNRLYSRDFKRLKHFLVSFAKDSTQVPFQSWELSKRHCHNIIYELVCIWYKSTEALVRIFGSQSSRRRVKKDCCQRNGQQGTYDDLMQFRCLGTWVKGAKTTKTQKPDSFLSNSNSQMCTKSSIRCRKKSKIKASVSKK